jgi:glycosyltransferase involved in cell wall biosynthesis
VSRGTPGPRVAVVVPAFNEADTLAEVLAALQAMTLWDELVVVSDGSTDDTAAIARAAGVTTVELRANRGKGHALAAGVAATTAPILLFVDADILRLSEPMLSSLVAPVLGGWAAMNVGIRHRGWLLNAIQRNFGPLLSGIRALRRDVFLAVPVDFRRGFRIETALNHYCRRFGGRIEVTVLHDLGHRVKEKKRGLWPGLRARVSMFAGVFGAWLRLSLGRPRVG